MGELIPFQQGIQIPARYRRAGLVYYVGGHPSVAQSTWVALCLTDEELLLCGQQGALASIHLSALRRVPSITTIQDVVIYLPTALGQEAIAPHLPYGVAVPHVNPISEVEEELILYVGYRNVAQEWVNRITAAMNLYHRRSLESLVPKGPQDGPRRPGA